jgi:hypothetical protein
MVCHRQLGPLDEPLKVTTGFTSESSTTKDVSHWQPAVVTGMPNSDCQSRDSANFKRMVPMVKTETVPKRMTTASGHFDSDVLLAMSGEWSEPLNEAALRSGDMAMC